MKAILEFNLPDENEDWVLHAKAGAFHAAVLDYALWLRDVCKHGEPGRYNAEDCRNKLYQFLNDNDVKL